MKVYSLFVLCTIFLYSCDQKESKHRSTLKPVDYPTYEAPSAVLKEEPDNQVILDSTKTSYLVRDTLYQVVSFEKIQAALKNLSFKVETNQDSILYFILQEEDLYNQNITYKPIIYLYPTDTIDVNVELTYDGELTHTYPKYNKSWQVKAFPDGTLFDNDSMEYYALYWEGKPNTEFIIDEGIVVAGNETVEFLEHTLEKLGLNRKEANEFIIYWLPKMENNNYNLIHFSTDQYKEMAQLSITPKPETLIRVMMVFQPLDTPISIQKQDLSKLTRERKGFTVVEWGGHPMTSFKNEI